MMNHHSLIDDYAMDCPYYFPDKDLDEFVFHT